MRKTIQVIVLNLAIGLVILLAGFSFAEPISKEHALRAAETFLVMQKPLPAKDTVAKFAQVPVKSKIINVREIKDMKGRVLAYIQELEPEGFVITSADDNVRPILGYSFKGQFSFEDSKDNVLLHLVQWDVEARLKALSSFNLKAKSVVEINNESWSEYLASDEGFFQTLLSTNQWPDSYLCPNCGHRQTDPGFCEKCGSSVEYQPGWIETDWNQEDHYNDFCPQDPKYNWMGPLAWRSLVGCTATAMAQIINYWKYPSSVDFTLDLDRYESKGKNHFWIPNDSDIYDYPDFTELNYALETLNYNGNAEEEAYLCFATGIKLEMNYSSSGSNAWRPQAYLDRFGYGSAEEHTMKGWASHQDIIIENIKKAWPVQIAIIKTGETKGHSVVLDGYRESDEYFHINYGWGGTNSSWYNLPNVNNYDLIPLIIYNIAPYKGWNQSGADASNTYSTVYTAPIGDPDIFEKWTVTTSPDYNFKGIVVGKGNTIYASRSPIEQGGSYHPSLWVINQFGEVEEEKTIVFNEDNSHITNPAQDSKGYVYVGTGNGNIYKIDPDLNIPTLLFTAPIGDGFSQPPRVDQGDYIYFVELYSADSPGTLYCIDGYGLKWSFTPPASKNINIYSGVVSVDIQRNRVYIAYYDSVGQKAYLGCLNRTSGNVIFEREWSNIQYADHSIKSVSLGKDGTIYVPMRSPSILYAINPDDFLGPALWSKDISPGWWLGTTPAIGFKEDNYTTDAIYISYVNSDDVRAISSLDPETGGTNWTKLLPVVSSWDAIGQIYVTGSINNRVVLVRLYLDNYPPGSGYHQLIAWKNNGSSATELWKQPLDAPFGGKTAFGPGATIYSTGSNIIYAHSDGEVGDPYGAGMGFTNNSAPSIPANPIPFDGTQDLGSSVTLSWTCSGPEGQALKYDVFLGDATSLMVPVATGLTSTSYTIDGLTEGTAYIWKVVVTDGQAISEGPTWSFQTAGVSRAMPWLQLLLLDD